MSTVATFLVLMVPATFFIGLYDVLAKRLLQKSVPETVLLAVVLTGTGILLSLVTFLLGGIPEILPAFWPAFLGTVILNVLLQQAWFRAFKLEDASLVAPLRLITPPLVLVTGFFLLDEVVTIGGILGVLTTILGLGMLLQSQAIFEKIAFRTFIVRPGVLLGLGGSLLAAISFPLDKQAVVNSSALFFSASAFLAIGAISIVWALVNTGRGSTLHLRAHARDIGVLILVASTGTWLASASLHYAFAAYAASTKRLAALWAIVLSGAFLKERNILWKLLATLTMIGGVVTTVVSG
jgi:drug/metabolite transporter (DMT)-like permease